MRSKLSLGALVVLAACQASPPPKAIRVTDVRERMATASIEAVFLRSDFERDSEGWTRAGVAAPRACGAIRASRLHRGDGPIVPLGGDYWDTRIDVRQHGTCRLDTKPPNGELTQGGELKSPFFSIRGSWLSARFGGSARHRLRLEVRDSQGTWTTPFDEVGPGSVVMRRVSWNVERYLGYAGRIFAVEAAGDPEGLLVDDVWETDGRLEALDDARLWGWSDMHAHPTAQLGFGTKLLFGDNDAPGSQGNDALLKALGSCEPLHGRDGYLGSTYDPAARLALMYFEQDQRGLGHRVSGAPQFDGWPKSTTNIHQQMYVDWIRRAYEGGQRVLVAHAVNNELLADSFAGKAAREDTAAIVRQVTAMKDLASRHDFMRIVTSAAEARRAILDDKLAVVLGAEVDALGGCRQGCTEEQARAAIRELARLGIRHVFPIHLVDNAFGGTSIYHGELFDFLQWYVTDKRQQTVDEPTLAFRLCKETNDPAIAIQRLSTKNPYGTKFKRSSEDCGPAPGSGHKNVLGLTPLGRAVVDEIFRNGMVVDIDHMSQSAREETIALARARKAPLAMGHSWYRALGYERAETSDWTKLTNEGMKTATELAAALDLGGAIAPITNQGDVKGVPGLPSTCSGSSQSWAQAYVHAATVALEATSSGASNAYAAVGVGTDFNGLAGQPRPRFGPYACTGRANHDALDDARRSAPKSARQAIREDVEAQIPGVKYGSVLLDPAEHRFVGPISTSPPTRAEGVQAYSRRERNMWRGVARHAARVTGVVSGDGSDVVNDVALGMADETEQTAKSALRRAAFHAARGTTPSKPDGGVANELRVLAPIVARWNAMSDSPAPPLVRSVIRTTGGAPYKDFDINLDGLAHYGLLPDLFQDVANQLRVSEAAVRDLDMLFGSAEAYVRMLAFAEAAARN